MNIVVCYQPTPEGEAALERAMEEASLRSAQLVVVDSSRDQTAAEPGGALEALQERLVRAGVKHEVYRPSHGPDAAEQVLAAATESGAGLVVIGLRQRSPVGKLVLGSAAQRILHDAPCPVLAVRSAG
jgi:nucleotide-binding universal stress UspA family protein